LDIEHQRPRQCSKPCSSGLDGEPVGLAQQRDHVLGPWLLAGDGLGDGDELAQVMGVAEGVQALEECIGAPVVVHEHAAETRQQAEFLQCLATALGVGEIGRQAGVGEHVQPLKAPAHAHAGLIGVSDRSADQCLADGHHRSFQALGRRLDRGIEGARGDLDPGQLIEHRGGALEGQQLVLRQVDGERRHPRPVLQWRADVLGKLAAMHTPASASTGNDPVFCHLAAHDQLKDLAPLGQDLNRDLGSAAPAGASALQRHDDPVLRVIHQGPGCAFVTLLSAWLASAHLALGARRWLAKGGIGRWWLTGIVAVLGQTCFQLRNPLAQQLNELRLLGNQCA